jgi:hypothetical protein
MLLDIQTLGELTVQACYISPSLHPASSFLEALIIISPIGTCILCKSSVALDPVTYYPRVLMELFSKVIRKIEVLRHRLPCQLVIAFPVSPSWIWYSIYHFVLSEAYSSLEDAR